MVRSSAPLQLRHPRSDIVLSPPHPWLMADHAHLVTRLLVVTIDPSGVLSSAFALVVTLCTHMIGWPSPCRKPSRLCSAHPHPDITPRQLLVRCAAVHEPCSRPTIHPCLLAPPPSPPRTVSPLLGWQRSPTPSAAVLLLGLHRRRAHARHQLMHAAHPRLLLTCAFSAWAGNPALIHLQWSYQNDVCARASIL
jgi:hypothetical protein